MPNPMLDKVSSTCKIDRDRVEELWNKAQIIAKKQYGKENKKNFELISAIFKHSLGKECINKLHWDVSWKKKPITEAVDELIKKITSPVVFYNNQNGSPWEKPGTIPQPTNLFQDYIANRD